MSDKMEKRLIDWDECEHCGNDLYATVPTDRPEGHYADGDTVTCPTEDCTIRKSITYDGETDPFVLYYTDEENE